VQVVELMLADGERDRHPMVVDLGWPDKAQLLLVLEQALFVSNAAGLLEASKCEIAVLSYTSALIMLDFGVEVNFHHENLRWCRKRRGHYAEGPLWRRDRADRGPHVQVMLNDNGHITAIVQSGGQPTGHPGVAVSWTPPFARGGRFGADIRNCLRLFGPNHVVVLSWWQWWQRVRERDRHRGMIRIGDRGHELNFLRKDAAAIIRDLKQVGDSVLRAANITRLLTVRGPSAGTGNGDLVELTTEDSVADRAHRVTDLLVYTTDETDVDEMSSVTWPGHHRVYWSSPQGG
jgi:hypothetical protein